MRGATPRSYSRYGFTDARENGGVGVAVAIGRSAEDDEGVETGGGGVAGGREGASERGPDERDGEEADQQKHGHGAPAKTAALANRPARRAGTAAGGLPADLLLVEWMASAVSRFQCSGKGRGGPIRRIQASCEADPMARPARNPFF